MLCPRGVDFALINDDPIFEIEWLIDSLDYSDDVEADRRVCVANKREAELSAVIADEKLDDEGARDLVKCAFQSADILESGTEVMGLMTKKPSRFGGGGTYATVKQRILDKLKAFYERFAGMGVYTAPRRSLKTLAIKGLSLLVVTPP